jgi:hypothetical protein
MTCPFCGQGLTGTRTVSCSTRACMLAAKRARGRARLEADPSKHSKGKRHDDGRSWDFPPELEYLDQDPGITVEQMLRVPEDPALRRLTLTKRAARWERLGRRQRQIL